MPASLSTLRDATRARRFRSLAFALGALCVGVSTIQTQPHQSAVHLLEPTDLRVNGWSDSLAIADQHPQFSWSLAAASTELHSIRQSAYEIEVNSGSDLAASSKTRIWKSGIVHSAITSGITYEGSPLAAQHEYAWRVRIWDEHGRASAWSAVAHWSQSPV